MKTTVLVTFNEKCRDHKYMLATHKLVILLNDFFGVEKMNSDKACHYAFEFIRCFRLTVSLVREFPLAEDEADLKSYWKFISKDYPKLTRSSFETNSATPIDKPWKAAHLKVKFCSGIC
jgi:hypothetical protein